MSKIDVHHHVYPPTYQQAPKEAGGDPSGWFIPEWSIESDKAISAAVENTTAMLSITAPGSSIVKDSRKAAVLAHDLNNYIAKLREDDPQGYGFFGTLLSLLDTDACLKEIAYVFDDLRADGVTLFTRYGEDNHYLGHPDFAPIWRGFSRRKAVVFIHPTHAVDVNLVNEALPQPMFDYPHETGRTAMDLIVSDMLRLYPDCKIILSHAGGTLPYLIYRAAGMLPYTPHTLHKSTEEVLEEARLFDFDTAISANEPTLKALLSFAKPGHIFFGTDFPNAPSPSIEYFTRNLSSFNMDREAREQIYSKAALELFPRLRPFSGEFGVGCFVLRLLSS